MIPLLTRSVESGRFHTLHLRLVQIVAAKRPAGNKPAWSDIGSLSHTGLAPVGASYHRSGPGRASPGPAATPPISSQLPRSAPPARRCRMPPQTTVSGGNHEKTVDRVPVPRRIRDGYLRRAGDAEESDDDTGEDGGGEGHLRRGDHGVRPAQRLAGPSLSRSDQADGGDQPHLPRRVAS